MLIQKCLYNACLGYLVHLVRYSAEMAEQSPDEQRKLASLAFGALQCGNG